MTTDEDATDSTTNTAEQGSTVGIQASHVENSPVFHESTVYYVPPDASASEQYAVGLNYLANGVPSQARELISKAIARGHDGGEIQFHWMLAMLSKRSYRDLTTEERNTVDRFTQTVHAYADDEWKRALQAICELLSCLTEVGRDPGRALQELHDLQPLQRDQIIQHLDLVLTGGIKDSLWAETRRMAKEGRFGHDRLQRVWAYFHPDPIGPRARPPAEESTTLADRIRALVWSCMFVTASGYLGWLALIHAAPLPILAYLLAIVAACVAAHSGREWRYRVERLAAKERAYRGRAGTDRTPDDGFASRVSRSFAHYFAIYVPDGTDRPVWLHGTRGIHKALRDEVVELYREDRVSVDRVNWLIRHLVSDVKRQWKNGSLWAFREHHRTPTVVKVSCVLALLALAPLVAVVVVAVVPTAPFSAVVAFLFALASGRAVAVGRLRIFCERQRYAEEHQDHEHEEQSRTDAYRRWKAKLESTRPSEGEMEAWLNCDKTMVLNDTLAHYRLSWRDIIAYAFLQTPTRGAKRACMPDGPWRFSKYDIRLFLVTQDGVREVGTEIEFERGILNNQDRNNYRFDAVSSVYVARKSPVSYTLELTLTNGPTRNIQITDPELQAGSKEDVETLAKINLDTAGFTHTLHILEGIAAEGKTWIDRDPRGTGDSDPDCQPSTVSDLGDTLAFHIASRSAERRDTTV
ncbi:hypothetical protein [Kutzneria sp. CA-103260]|uniref:hypothetical protein n=1 Tax=Kutzneria sp. CA-103260 TaxID=2802641 RepID=UPI001BAD928A|nr:hypothetical protein [Kutzneria sp. CA-103260]QUQ64553.1 hypothetical protein JJ691_22730 [Kutzneria sp. CA-103260]